MKTVRSVAMVFLSNLAVAALFTAVWLGIDAQQQPWWSFQRVSPRELLLRAVVFAVVATVWYRRQEAKRPRAAGVS